MEWHLSANLVNEISIADRVPGISEYGLVGPAPPCDGNDLNQFKTILFDENIKIFERMRLVFSLRNDRSPEAIEILC